MNDKAHAAPSFSSHVPLPASLKRLEHLNNLDGSTLQAYKRLDHAIAKTAA
jgi:hypothetical protein